MATSRIVNKRNPNYAVIEQWSKLDEFLLLVFPSRNSFDFHVFPIVDMFRKDVFHWIIPRE